jgi:CRISPR-associated endoribonuclease Cas6
MVRFGDGNSSNTLRGAFGTVLREVACTPRCSAAGHQPGCAYARIFEPRALRPNGPSGLADWPRPFIFRTRHLDSRTLPSDEDFHFDIHLFDPQLPVLYFAEALKRLATEGLGPRRGRATLTCIEQLDTDGRLIARVWDGVELSPLVAPSAASLEAEPCDAVRVRFVTPTELKCGNGQVERPEFSVLFARIRDRLSTLRALYGPGPLEIDFRGMGARAAGIRMTRCDLRTEHRVRRSSRTGQVHPWGGFTGEAEYQGDLAEFMPYLRVARWTGVGRQTVWGKGEIAAESLHRWCPVPVV